MASGQTLFPCLKPGCEEAVSANMAEQVVIAGASTPNERVLAWAFDDTTTEYVDIRLTMPSNYAGTTGVTIKFKSSSTATSNTYVLSAAFRRIQDDAEDLDTTAQTYDYNDTGAITPASASGEITYDSLTFTNGADMDSVVAGEDFILRVRRNPGSGSDTVTGDVFLQTIEMLET